MSITNKSKQTPAELQKLIDEALQNGQKIEKLPTRKKSKLSPRQFTRILQSNVKVDMSESPSQIMEKIIPKN